MNRCGFFRALLGALAVPLLQWRSQPAADPWRRIGSGTINVPEWTAVQGEKNAYQSYMLRWMELHASMPERYGPVSPITGIRP